MESWKRKIAPLTIAIVALLPLFDVLNSSMVHSNVLFGNIGQLSKLLLFALLFCFYLTKRQRTTVIIAFFMILCVVFIHTYGTNNSITADLLFFSKIGFLPISIWGFTNFVKAEKENYSKLVYVVGLTWAFYALNAISTLFGFGSAQYQSGGGLKGFFYAGNEFALSFLLQTTILAAALMQAKREISFLVFALIAMLVAFIIGMKTVMIGIFLILVVTFAQYASAQFIGQLKRYAGYVIIIGTILAAIGIAILYKQNFFYRLQFHQDNGVISFLTSNRDKTAVVALEEYATFTVQEKLFGIGKTATERRLGPHFNVIEKAVEMDPVDLLLYGGAISVIVVYGVWLVVLVELAKQYRYGAILSFILLLISIIAGHVIYAGMAIPYLGLLFAIIRSKKENQQSSIYFIGALSRGGIATYMQQAQVAGKAAGADITLVGSHSGRLIATVFYFPAVIIRLACHSLFDIIAGRKTIFHYHVATGGSFVRKYFLALLFWPFVDVQIIHFHSGKTADFLNSYTKKKSLRFIVQFFFKLFDEVLFVSTSLRQSVTELFKQKGIAVNTTKWQTLPNAIQLPPTLPTPASFKPLSTLKLLFVGRLVDEKDLPTLLTIMADLKARAINTHLTIVGDGPLKEWLCSEIKQQQLGDYISYLGWQDHQTVLKTYGQHHGFIITSKQESFGLVVLEAYTNGLFAIATANGGLTEIVVNNKTGYIEPTADWKTLVGRIETLAKSPDRVKELQASAQEFVKRFDFSKHIAQLAKLY
jgi:glycosyltransferase involved in cell wall biosynthesis